MPASSPGRAESNAPSRRGAPPARDRLLVWGIAALALALRLYGAAGQSYWTDELFSVFHVRDGWGEIVAATFDYETNPPLYYLLLKAWIAIFGDRELATRSLSAILGALTVPVIFAVGRTVTSRGAAILAALFFAFASLQIEFGQESRPYALMVLALSLAWLGLARAVVERGADGAPPRRAGALFAGGIALAAYSHDAAFIYWLAMDLCAGVFVMWAAGWEFRRAPVRRFFSAWAMWNLAAAVAAAPQLYAVAILRQSLSLAWIESPTAAYVFYVLKAVFFSVLAQGSWGYVGLAAVMAALIWAAAVTRRDSALTALCAILPVAAFVSLVLVSLLRPILLSRTALWVPVPLYLLLAAAFARIRPIRLRDIAVAAAFGCEALTATLFWTQFSKERWNEMVANMATAAAPTDVFVFVPYFSDLGGIRAFLYYWPGEFDLTRCRLIDDEDIRKMDGARGMPFGCRATTIEGVLADDVAKGRTAWFIGRVGYSAFFLDMIRELQPRYAVNSWQWTSSRGPILLLRVAVKPHT